MKETAAKNGLHALGDLKKVQGLKLGGQPEFRTRNTGLVGLRPQLRADRRRLRPVRRDLAVRRT